MAEVEIFTDGACRGNPGPGGWGALLQSGSHRKELWGGERNTTNNRMELTAAIKALDTLTRSTQVNLYTDSQYVRQGITQWLADWKRRGWRTSRKTPVKNADLWQQLEALAEQHSVRWHWVKGHSGHAGNDHADMLANRAVDELLADTGQ
jgi:ribonuclease HI